MKRTGILAMALLMGSTGLLLDQSESLFNGKDLTGWTIYGTELWYVEDGLLVCESGPDKEYGYLATDKEYKNSELILLLFIPAENSNFPQTSIHQLLKDRISKGTGPSRNE